MSAISKLTDLFNNDFVVFINDEKRRALKVADLFQVVRKLDIDYTIDEYFQDTWMGDGGFGYNFEYFGISNGYTYMADSNWSKVDALTLEQFTDMVTAAVNESNPDAIPLNKPGVFDLDTNLVVSGGTVVVNYKNGQKFHLYTEGKATLDPKMKTLTTEHKFIKDSQPAYERVVINIDKLESVESDSNKILFLEDGKVAFVTLYTL